jgi:DNA-binding NtrC family response regulator
LKKNDFKILVAEDDAMVLDVIVKFLSDEGYSVTVANDGLGAIKLLRLEDIKLVFADLRMPGADGMEVLREAIQINPKIAVVLITAYGTLDTALVAMKEGAYDYIVKPFVIQQLLLVVRNAYKMANLIEEKEKLSNQIKEMYRSHGSFKTQSENDNETLTLNSVERIKKLQELKIINEDEAEVLRERLISDTESENKIENERIKKYSTLVNDLKIRKATT